MTITLTRGSRPITTPPLVVEADSAGIVCRPPAICRQQVGMSACAYVAAGRTLPLTEDSVGARSALAKAL